MNARIMVLLMLPALSFPAPAVAQAPRVRSQTLYRDGLAEFKAGHYREALAAFQAAREAGLTPDILWSVARCHEELGEYREAVAAYAEFTEFTRDQSARARAQERINRLMQRMSASLVVVVSEAGADVRVDGRMVGTSPLSEAVRLGPGSHEVSVSKIGFEPVEEALAIKANETRTVRASLRPIRVLRPVVPVEATVKPPPPRVSALKAALFWGGLSVAAAGGFVHLWGRIDYGDLNNEARTWSYKRSRASQAKRKYYAAYCLYGLGGAAVVTSFVVPGRGGHHPLFLAAQPMPDGVAVSAVLGW